MSSHQKVTLAAEEFSNQVDRLTYYVGSQHFPPTIYAISHEQSGHDSGDGGYAWARSYRFPLTTPDLATAASESQICQYYRPTLSPQCGTIPQWPVSDVVACWLTLYHFLHGKDNNLPLTVAETWLYLAWVFLSCFAKNVFVQLFVFSLLHLPYTATANKTLSVFISFKF